MMVFGMDFGALPPEINSGRMYLGPGPVTMLAAAAGWESMATELIAGADGYETVIAALAQDWQGPTSASMEAAVMPYVAWMRLAAAQCAQAASQSTAAVASYETAYAMTVPPPLVAANRAQLVGLIATNFLGHNTPAIMATEAEYSEMWAQDATAMYDYAAGSAAASTFSSFTAPPRMTNPVVALSNLVSTSTQLMPAVAQALRSLAAPGSSPISTASANTSSGSGVLSGLTSSVSAAPGATSAGLGSGGGGRVFEGYGLPLNSQGAGSTIESEGGTATAIPGLDDFGGLGSLGPVAGLGEDAWASLGEADSLGDLSVPPSWADALSSADPLPATVDANVMPGGWGAAVSPTAPRSAGISQLPTGTTVGRGSAGAAPRIGLRSSLISRSPVAG